MGFLDDFMGKSQKRDLENASQSARNYTEAGYRSAGNQLRSGYRRAGNSLSQGVNDAVGSAEQYRGQATDYLDPAIEGGNQARELYETGLGLNGDEARDGFIDGYRNDPFREFNEDRQSNALLRTYNAAGMGNSGASRLAVARAGLERGTQDYNSYLDRLRGLSSEGGQYASQAAGITANTGAQIGGYQYGGGNTQAGLDFSYGQQRAGLSVDRASTLAGNRINTSNAVAQSRTAGINNLLQLGGTALKAFAPGSSGTSAAGNISKAFSGGGLG